MTVALIDGDIIAYRAAVLGVDDFDGEEFFDPDSVEQTVTHIVTDWTQKAKAGTQIVCLSDETHRYFRHDIYPDYKGNRKDRERPAALTHAYDCLKKNFKTTDRPGLEADDVMGILSGSPDLTDPIIVSIDKDMLTVPARVFNPDKMRRPLKVRKAAADRQMLTQALVGDRTDGYPGLDGIGPVKADKIISQHSRLKDCWEAVVEAFGSEADALTMTRLSRILRYDDWNEETKELRLWHPTKEIWIPSTTPNTTGTGSLKRSTTSSRSRKTYPATKRSASRKSSNTQVGTTKRKSRSKTSRKPVFTLTS